MIGNTEKIPPECDRCHHQAPQIRVHFKDHGFKSFICYDCRNRDPLLSKLPVKPRESSKDTSGKGGKPQNLVGREPERSADTSCRRNVTKIPIDSDPCVSPEAPISGVPPIYNNLDLVHPPADSDTKSRFPNVLGRRRRHSHNSRRAGGSNMRLFALPNKIVRV